MKAPTPLRHEFVRYIPEQLAERTLYISIEFTTAVHNCFCGCGQQVVTPLTPTDWQLIFDGDTVSLYPSVGSWNLPCQSHYIVRRNQAIWMPKWTPEMIEEGRRRDRAAKGSFYGFFDRALSDGPADLE